MSEESREIPNFISEGQEVIWTWGDKPEEKGVFKIDRIDSCKGMIFFDSGDWVSLNFIHQILPFQSEVLQEGGVA